ncbi:hypothetical protein G7Y79_00012g032220 [Physcia stellaris]|nr:hypothetical protein G7Y79_00012g032220 [Physcia stellaris]
MAPGMRDMIDVRASENSQQVAQEPSTPERSHHLAQEPCYFLTLSREIRDMIYGYVLINEHTIEPYPPFPEDERKPLAPQITSLLRTNKLISAEARQMFYDFSPKTKNADCEIPIAGKNRWRIPIIDTIDSATIFHKHPHLFKNITLAFDQRDLSPAKRLEATKSAHSRPRYSGRAVHSKMRREMEAIWWNARVTLCLHLQSNLWKPRARFGFHATILEMLSGGQLGRDFGEEGMVPKVYVKGLLNEQEDDLFCKQLKFLEVPYDEEVMNPNYPLAQMTFGVSLLQIFVVVHFENAENNIIVDILIA